MSNQEPFFRWQMKQMDKWKIHKNEQYQVNETFIKTSNKQTNTQKLNTKLTNLLKLHKNYGLIGLIKKFY